MKKWAMLQQSDVLLSWPWAIYDRHAAKDSELGKKIERLHQAREGGKYRRC